MVKKNLISQNLGQAPVPLPEVSEAPKTTKRLGRPEKSILKMVEEEYPSRPNAWLTHVKNVRTENPELSYKEALVKAKETYTKA
jgi:hypothetical protein